MGRELFLCSSEGLRHCCSITRKLGAHQFQPCRLQRCRWKAENLMRLSSGWAEKEGPQGTGLESEAGMPLLTFRHWEVFQGQRRLLMLKQDLTLTNSGEQIAPGITNRRQG